MPALLIHWCLCALSLAFILHLQISVVAANEFWRGYSSSPVYIVIVILALTEELAAIYMLSVSPPTHLEIGHDGIVAVHVNGGCSGVHICDVAYISCPVDKVIASI
jgi:hypothetical protein